MRLLKVGLLAFGVWVLSAMARALALSIDPRPFVAWLASTTVPVVLMLPVVGRLGCRKRHALLVAVPVIGHFWLWHLLWRLVAGPRSLPASSL